jgi:hypothetical protein
MMRFARFLGETSYDILSRFWLIIGDRDGPIEEILQKGYKFEIYPGCTVL